MKLRAWQRNAKWLARSHNDNVTEMTVKERYKNGWQYPAISVCSFSGKESNFSNAGRQTWHTRWHFAMPHRMADFSPFLGRRGGTRNFRSILLRQTRRRRRKFALSHRTPSPSITAATVLSGGDGTAIHSKNPTCPGQSNMSKILRDTCQINRKQFVPGTQKRNRIDWASWE